MSKNYDDKQSKFSKSNMYDTYSLFPKFPPNIQEDQS